MPNPDVAWSQREQSQASQPSQEDSRWRRFTASLPMRTALLAVAAVWFLGAVWSFTEQSAFAGNKGFSYPHLLPLVIDGFAVAMAGVAWAASLDARPAVAARLATVIAVAASSASNGAWAYLRTNHDLTAVVLGVSVPVAANLAFEVLLAEMRRQVQRRRGLPPPVAIPYPRLIRLGLAPFRTFVEWRALVLELTHMDLAVSRPPALTTSPGLAASAEATASPEPETSPEPAAPTAPAAGPAVTAPPGVAPAAGRYEPVRAEQRAYEPARRESASREPVGIERVRRELAQYSEITRQEPVRREPAGREPNGYEPVPHESSTREANGYEPAGDAPTEYAPTAYAPTEYAPTAYEPTAYEPSGGPAVHREPVHRESVSREPVYREPVSHQDAPEPAPTARVGTYAPSDAPAEQPTRLPQAAPSPQNGQSPARRRDLEAVPAAAPARLSAAQPPARTSTPRRTVDPRVEMLATHLANTEDAGEFTGEMVGPLLNIDVAPRTGRRLLGQARELVNERAQTQTDPRDDELSAAIGGG